MNVGILTMHRVINYGSFMQAYALKRSVESLGHRVDFRDFVPGAPRHLGEKTSAAARKSLLRKIPSKLGQLGKVIEKKRFKADMEAMFDRVVWPLLGTSSARNHSLQADAMLVGSDEVFNYTQNHAFGYVPCLFGHGIEAPIIASYAASAGYATFQDVLDDGMLDELTSGLRRFTHISVRDENTRQLVQGCLQQQVDMVIDPTLIHDFTAELPGSIPVKPGYVLVYAYEGRMDAPDEVAAVQAFARQQGLRTVAAGGFQPWCDENLVLEPFALLQLFAGASHVVTDTFHGSIFAMKASRPFATLIRTANAWGSNANKVGFLLHQLGMQSRIIGDMSRLEEVLETPPPYAEYAERLAPLQAQSIGFLHKALGAR